MSGIGPGDDRDRLIDSWYCEHYNSVAATADGSLFHRYVHRQMERPYPPSRAFGQVLEVGGHDGEHLPFVTHRFNSYVLTDLRPPRPPARWARDPRVTTVVCDVHQLPFDDRRFDRVIATCLLHHVDNPLRVLHELRRVVRPASGRLTLLLPTDPGLAYVIGQRLTSGRAAKRLGVRDRHRLVTALDHRNHFRSLMAQLQYVFRKDRLRLVWRPFGLPGQNHNAFVVAHVRRAG